MWGSCLKFSQNIRTEPELTKGLDAGPARAKIQ